MKYNKEGMVYVLSSDKKILVVRTTHDIANYFIRGVPFKWYGNKFSSPEMAIEWINEDIRGTIDIYICMSTEYELNKWRETLCAMFVSWPVEYLYAIDGFIVNFWKIKSLKIIKCLFEYEYIKTGEKHLYFLMRRLLQRLGMSIQFGQIEYFNYFMDVFDRIWKEDFNKYFSMLDVMHALKLSIHRPKAFGLTYLDYFINDNMTIYHARFYIWIVYRFIGSIFTDYYLRCKGEVPNPTEALSLLDPIINYISGKVSGVKLPYIRGLSILFLMIGSQFGRDINYHKKVKDVDGPPVPPILSSSKGVKFLDLICEEWMRCRQWMGSSGEFEKVQYYDMSLILGFGEYWNTDRSVKTIEELEEKYEEYKNKLEEDNNSDVEKILYPATFKIFRALMEE